MAHLYINSRGLPWTKHSYSAGQDFDSSALKYYLRRILGWKETDNKASLKFGRALEESIQFYHNNDGRGAVEDFIQRWGMHEQNKEMLFTKVEKSWENLNRCGIEMLKLYSIRQPSLPLPLGGSISFQREFTKEVFPDDPNYGGIEFLSKLDTISWVQPDHPMLPKIEWKPEYGLLRPLITDIKTSGKDYPDRPGISAFDQQLRSQSWVSGHRDVAFLVFKKNGHELKKGSSVTLLEDSGNFKAGDEAVVAQVVGDNVYLLANDYFMGEMDKAQGIKEDGAVDQTKAAKERRDVWLANNAALTPKTSVTRQRLQFNAGYVTIESAQDAAWVIGRQITEIVNLSKTHGNRAWPNTFGIKFPKDDRKDPYFRAFVERDEEFKKQYFSKADDGALDDLFAETGDESEPD